MANFDFSTLKPEPAKLERTPRGRAAQDRGPNPFLDEGWLKESYEAPEGNRGRHVIVPGAIEEYRPVVREHLHTWAELNGWVKPNGVLKNGARDAYLEANGGQGEGEIKTRPTGVAADVVRMLRQAANMLEIGVAIQWKPAKKGHVEIVYEGQERKHKGEPDE
jgi:hypothetical protein